MSTNYNFTSTDDFDGIQHVEFDFETESLQDITEKFFWFLHASGFPYVDEIKVGNCTFEFK